MKETEIEVLKEALENAETEIKALKNTEKETKRKVLKEALKQYLKRSKDWKTIKDNQNWNIWQGKRILFYLTKHSINVLSFETFDDNREY